MLYVISPEKAEIREYKDPALAEGQILVKTEFAAAKHGTEKQYVTGQETGRGNFDREWRLFMPAEPAGAFEPGGESGNMFTGTVIKVAKGVKAFKAGDKVLSYGPFRETQIVAVEDCLEMPEKLSWKSAVCLDPADFALSAVRDGGARCGDAVAIFGMGAIGLMAVQISKLSGAGLVIAVDPLANRRAAATKCGADIALDPRAVDAGYEIKKATGKRGADVAIEISGNWRALQAAVRGVAFGGNVVVGSFPAPYPAGLDFGAEAHMNRPNIIFSRAVSDPNREHPRWTRDRVFEVCWRLIREGKLHGEHVVTPVVPFDKLATEYPKIISKPETNIKLGAKF